MFHTGRIAQRSLSNGAGPAVLAQHAVPVRTYPHRRHASTQVQPHYTVLWRCVLASDNEHTCMASVLAEEAI